VDYIGQIEKSIIFMEANLCEDIKVQEIAGAAGYSYYHFHRIFEAVLGETVGNYLRSRRLTRAAGDLIYTDKNIISIAIEYQFESQEAFTRAFKNVYNVTPGTYRKNRIHVVVGSKKELTLSNLRHLKDSITVQPRIVELERKMIVGIKGSTTIRKNRIPEMWDIFNPRAGEIKNPVPGLRGYGICEADPDYDMARFDEETEFNELIGIEVTEFNDLPEGMTSKILTGGKYAVFTHTGKVETLSMTYDYIWGTWIPYSGYELALNDDFEFYDERFLGQNNELSQMDIYIPIK
jgi:Uncharacterized protein conserved in bacteria